ncbi:glycoside hydrolase family 79 protein [Hypoxylon sp. EC38]|nr:glycoside hydrolase family 79 protein [Hypoxylon sp. EC38]
MWRAVNSTAYSASVSANFYSQPFIADFIGKGGNTQVVELDVSDDGEGTLVAYGAYESGKLARVALLNLDLWITNNGTRHPVDFALKGLSGVMKKATVHHLSAPDGALAKEGLTYAGLEWTLESMGIDKHVRDDSKVLNLNGTDVTVSVNATSAVMIVL